MAISVEEQLKKAASKEVASKSDGPAFIEATFKGEWYKGVGSHTELIPFTQTVKIPEHWLAEDKNSPASVFVFYFAKRMLSDNSGYSGVRDCYLAETSELPHNLSVEQRLVWTADYDSLAAIAKKTVNTYQPMDAEARLLPKVKVTIDSDLYPDSNSLRAAIIRLITEPQAFEAEQSRRKSMSNVVEKRSMEADLAAIYGS